jgi:hypothetical protein
MSKIKHKLILIRKVCYNYMASLYDELLANIGKTASTDNVKQGIQSFSSDELIRLAEDLAVISKDKDLAEMAKLLPVYSANQSVEEKIDTEQIIQSVKPSEAPIGDDNKDDIALMASTSAAGAEKLAGDKKEDEEEEEKKKKDEEEEEEEVTATEALYAILKQGAALEEMIEVRASEMAYDMIKQAEDYEVARQITEEAAVALSDNPVKAHEYSEQMMDKARTVAAANDIPMSDAAAVVATKVVETAKTAGLIQSDLNKEAAKIETAKGVINIPDELMGKLDMGNLDAAGREALERGKLLEMINETKQHNLIKKLGLGGAAAAATAGTGYGVYNAINQKEASVLDYFGTLDKYATELESEYEKVAEAIMDAAESLVLEHGIQQGLSEPELFEYTRVSMDAIKTLAAKRDLNLAQAAQAFLAGDTGSTTGVVEPTVPSPSQVPSPAKAPINSNQTQSPDALIPEMVAPADPQVAAAAEEEKKAELSAFIKSLVKEAMLEAVSAESK